MNIGDNVIVVRRKKGEKLRGTLVRFEEDDCIANPEQHATIKNAAGNLFAFKRGRPFLFADWLGQAKTTRAWGYVSIEPAPGPGEEEDK